MRAPIDWREVYAANQAVIHGARRPGASRRRTTARPLRAISTASPAPHDGGEWLSLGGRRVLVHTASDPAAAPAPLLVMLHGCTQDPADFARGTAMDAAADSHGFVVAYPEQPRSANPQGCWNWFAPEHQGREGGEPASLAQIATALAGDPRRRIDPGRVFVAGLSAGGAMAGIAAATRPDVFAGVAIHSGLPYASADGIGSALQAMTRGARDPAAAGRAAHAAMGAAARPVPALVLHGDADRTVRPCNGAQAAAQWCETNRLASASGQPLAPDRPERDGRTTRHRWRDADGRVLVEHSEIDGLGHAWSGGSAAGSHTDALGPDATAAIVAFLGLTRR